MRAMARGVLTFAVVFSWVAAARADERSDALAIIKKGIAAVGGAEKLAKFKAQTWKEEGTFYGMGEGLPFTSNCAVQFPDRFKMEIVDFFLIVLDGKQGWQKFANGGDTSALEGDELKEHLESHYAGWVARLLPLSDKAFQLKPLGKSTVSGNSAVGVLVSRDGHRDVKLFFDAKSGLLVKSEFNVLAMDPQGQEPKEVMEEILYDDYQEIEGLRLPKKVTLNRDGKKFVEATIMELQVSEKLDDEVFAKP
jgi:hypothetical protein